ncbi:AlwI family type II restriction endonuclease [Microvirga sp. SRT01]|uniref:AlwI family type II restriction endonuclease n=1 Tax=Sphingomonas longa TaxID=2778730 RepID=A0ABS2DAG2_9SPHN|nr:MULTISPECIES: DUF3883 domain-containing protein [Alphaproteobacteria]MBM6577939.1 AlwI family type II restriction endonuclease [Sphingomonas sp. BT552]MBR7710980.1 AlwI family type II restriction endonuclease [Microvirga sp. SRT01]
MVLEDLRHKLIERLDDGVRGDRGWWLVTRVHLTPARITEVARFLAVKSVDDYIELTEQNYEQIGEIMGIRKDAEKNVKRHIFLAMDQPLRLIERAESRSWSKIRLTDAGRKLASSDDPIDVFEQVLHDIRFAQSPWYSEGRQEQYPEFDVAPYAATLEVLRLSTGYIDNDEFDLFVSRIRTDGEIASTVASIAAFRSLRPEDRTSLLRLVEERIPAEGGGKNKRKAYFNWRDVARHTFSLLSLGVSAEREGNRLWLASELLIEAGADHPATSPANPYAPDDGKTQPEVGNSGGRTGTGTKMKPSWPAKVAGESLGSLKAAAKRSAGVRPSSSLLIPDDAAPVDLLEPPAAPQVNDGFEAELLVAKIFKANGWQVAYYGRKRGYGFDLWTRKDDQAFLVEVKSFSGTGGTVTLTKMEHAAAAHYKGNYLLVVVEMISATPRFSVIPDPVTKLQPTETSTEQYSIPQSAWSGGAVAFNP